VFVLLLLLLASVAGCAANDAVAIPTWTLDAPGATEPASVTLPIHLGSRLPDRPSSYTLRARFPMPAAYRGRTLTFAIPRLAAPVVLRAQGHAMQPIDPPRDSYRGDDAVRFRIPAEADDVDALDLELTIEHRWTQSAWLDTIPRLSATEKGDAEFLRIRAFNDANATIGCATVYLVAFAYVIIFFLHRQRTAHGWFALEAVLGGSYPLFALGLTTPIFGVYDVAVSEAAVLFTGLASVHFTHAQFRLGRPSRWFAIAWAVGLIAIAARAGPYVSTRGACVTVAGIVVVVVYQLARMTRLVRARPRPMNAILILGSWGLLGAVSAVDFVAWLGFGELLGGLRGASLGIAVLALLHSGALSREHFAAQKNAEELNAQLITRVELLEAKNREVYLLNEELRHQVSSRSEDLADALSRIHDAPVREALRFGDVVDDRYRVVRELGSGGMGVVYEVERTSDARRLALKVLNATTDRAGLARFAREAQIASQLEHPNVVSVLDVDVTATGTLFIVMEHVDGPSLDQAAARYADRVWALDVLAQISAGLAAIHSRGIVHRDLKPANVLLARDPMREGASLVKIADFGISSLGESSQGSIEDADTIREDLMIPPTLTSSKLTKTGAILGTPLYMAPELARGANFTSPAVDVFSFGIIAFELLVGERPYPEPTMLALLRGRSFPPLLSFAARCAGLDVAVAECLERCLSSAPSARPSASELHAALSA
jgi:hypothetical protein